MMPCKVRRLIFMTLLAGLLAQAPTVRAANFTSEGQIFLGQKNFLSAPNPASAQLQKSANFLWATPSLQWAGDETRLKFKMVAGLDGGEIETKDRTQIIPQELFIEHRRTTIRFLAGLNTYNWGVTDVLNPLDVINPCWMRNPLSPQKIGSAGIAMTWTPTDGTLDLVYIPRQFRHELPTRTSRYLPRDASFGNYVGEFQDQPVPIQLPTTPLRFSFKDADDKSRALDHNLAVRFQRRVGSLDVHSVGFEGIPSFPDFSDPQVTLTPVSFSPPTLELQPDVELETKYQRVRVAGFGFSGDIAGVTVKLAHAETWRTSRDYEISLPRTSVLGLEKSFSIKGVDTTVVYQAAAVGDTSGLANSVYSTREIFDQSHLLGLRLSQGLDWNLLLAVLYNPNSSAQVTQAEGQYRLNDTYQLKLSAQVIRGQPGTLAHSLSTASDAQMGFLVYW
jgi:hypothetical protein